MGLVSAFLSGPQEIIPAGQTKVELFVFTHDNLNKGTAKWQIKEGANTYNVTADAGGHGKTLVPSGKTYTVTLTISGTYEGGKTTSFVANSCEVVLCHFILGDQVTKGGAQVITGAKHFSAQPTADTRAYNPANKTDLVSIKSLQESSDVVHTSGDTMTGRLNANGGITIERPSNPGIVTKQTSKGYNSSWARYRWDRVFDKDENSIGEMSFACRYDEPNLGRLTYIAITATNYKDDGTAVNGFIVVKATGSGKTYVELPMRDPPGTMDAVNTKYVLDRVDELVGFIEDEVSTHEGRKDNPHAVTKAQVGLGNVDNTSDADKPISTATQTALDGKADTFSLYEHTIRIWSIPEATKKMHCSLTVLNQSPTAFTFRTLRDYLGTTSADDWKQCTGFALDPRDHTEAVLIAIRAVGIGYLFDFKAALTGTGGLTNVYYDWMDNEILLADKVRQIV